MAGFGGFLKAARTAAGLTQRELAERIGARHNSVSNWEKGRSNPDTEIILRLCEVLEVTPNYLLTGGAQAGAGGRGFEQTPSERAQIRKYLALDSHGRRVADFVIDEEFSRVTDAGIAAAEEAAEREPEKIIPLYRTPAAAGRISPAHGDEHEDYAVPAGSRADFAVRIAGDSMEPYIEDGAVVLVERTTALSDGDVGIFYVDGDMKCKQYCEDAYNNIYLFSLNRERSDADVKLWSDGDVTVYCFGRVLLHNRPPLPM